MQGGTRLANQSQTISADAVRSAKQVGLRYVMDNTPGIRRERRGDDFVYLGLNGRPIRSEIVLNRVRKLRIPPAWTDVWICPLPEGHLQATGRDSKGRKQYRYHEKWSSAREETKYSRMIAFAKALPRIRRQVNKDLALPGLPRRKVLAVVVRLLETTLIRVGNEEYARMNRSYGLCTMRDQHVEVEGSKIHFQFRGKHGIRHSIDVADPKLAKLVQRCQDLPGQELFQYVEDGKQQSIESADVNEYLREVAGEQFTAKDFRTWAGTVLAALALSEFAECCNKTQAKKNIVQAIESVSKRLGNTKAICKKCYVHPAVFDAYLDGTLVETIQQRATKMLRSNDTHLRVQELAVIRLLQHRLNEETRRRKTG